MKRYLPILLAVFASLSDGLFIFRMVSGAPFSPVNQPLQPLPLRELFEIYLLAKMIITTVNLILLLLVFIIYIRIYNNTGSKFSLGLVFFTIALILYAVTSNPILHVLTGFRGVGLGPFTMLPDLFTLIASAILLYLSRQ
ncbi:hypothetical protein KEJ47_04945 [Candidatus Bathyarchaeota archaeon]|nr:hypothetical protein [Candidatus Bathyarchaeota archaeon]